MHSPQLKNNLMSSGICQIYDRWPELAKESFESDISTSDFQNIDHIIFAGMGGSGTMGDIFASLLSKTDIHVGVVKGYVLPKTVDSNTLVVTTSVSGNTAETLSVLQSAKKIGSKIIAFSSGGKMQRYCMENKIEYRCFPQKHSPRASFPVFLYSALKALHEIIPITNNEIHESIKLLENYQKKINSSNLDDSNQALSLAKWILGTPLIYYPSGLQSAAIRFKNSLHENSKLQVFLEEISEACHNQIVGWEKTSNAKPILIEGDGDHITTKEKWKIIKEYFEANDIDYREIISVKGNILSKLISLIYLLDYSSIYHAFISGIDPSPVNSINFVKSRQKLLDLDFYA